MALLETLEKQGNFLFKYRGVLPLAVMLPGCMLIYVTDFSAENIINENHIYEAICLLVSLLGLAVRILAVGFSDKNTSGRNTKIQVADSLNTSGLYSVVRHPLYFANFLMWIGLCMRTANLPFILFVSLFFWIYYERIMFAEEQFLRRKYGQVYLEWANSTPAFIPNFRSWKPATLPFNGRKVIVQERTGVLVLFVCFFITELLISKNASSVFGHEWLWTAALTFSVICYFSSKYLLKRC